jgi:DsbC/DsbD-like thiol-disulfide interchange protein
MAGALAMPVAVRADAKPWAVRLMGGMPDGDGYVAGLEVTLDPDWKTYWRMPGEAGIPPDFGWSRSRNLASAEVLFPAPHRFVDGGGEGVGYKEQVVFPVRVVPADRAKPVELELDLFFAVCKDICIPAQGKAYLSLGATSPSAADIGAIEQALRDVPVTGGIKPFTSATLGEREGRLTLLLTAPGDSGISDIFVESDTGAYFRSPRREADGQFLLPVDGVRSPDDLKGTPLRLTVTGATGALEQEITVE